MWNDDDNDRPGFGRPPRYTRFRKGQSGNPKGRPRKAAPPVVDDLEETPQETILRKLLAREAGKPFLAPGKAPTALEALLLAQYQSALKGNQFAARHILDAQANMEQRDRARIKAKAERERERFTTMVKWKALRVQEWEKAEREDREPEEVWPHPDDILIDEKSQSYRIRGPLDESMVPYFDYLVAMRDLCICEESLALRRRSKLHYYIAALYEVAMHRYEAMLPLRWQHGSELRRITFAIDMMGTRELKKLTASIKAEALHWHKIAFPNGQRIKLGPRERKLWKPFLPILEVRSIAELERQWEQESGNPPIMSAS